MGLSRLTEKLAAPFLNGSILPGSPRVPSGNKIRFRWPWSINAPQRDSDSLIDNFKGHWSRLKHPREDFYNFFDFYEWDEEEINSTIISEYNWETAIDTKNTWRIGDGTSPIYNYIYWTYGGFTENDFYRSNQIREGHITRDEALDKIHYENQPRFDLIKNYSDLIEVDYDFVIKKLNEFKKKSLVKNWEK